MTTTALTYTLTENSNAHGTERLIPLLHQVNAAGEPVAEVVYRLDHEDGYLHVVDHVVIYRDADGDFAFRRDEDGVWFSTLDEAVEAARDALGR